MNKNNVQEELSRVDEPGQGEVDEGREVSEGRSARRGERGEMMSEGS